MKKWTINVRAKAKGAETHSADLFTPGNLWTYNTYKSAKAAFDNIPISENEETLCELIEFDESNKETSLRLLESKFSTPFATKFIIPGDSSI